MPTSPAESKRQLRQTARHRRSELDEAYRHQAEPAIRDRILDLVADLPGLRHIGLYAAMPDEVSVDALCEALTAQGLAVAFPRTERVPIMTFHEMSAPPLGAGGRMGLREPDPDRPVMDELDLVIVPGLAFDRRGARLGFGAGYYDRWLAEHPATSTAGVCHGRLLLPEVPTEAHDQLIDAVVTEDAVYR